MLRFVNLVRAAEGLVSPVAIDGKISDLNAHNFALHELALARQYSLVGSTKRCSRAEAWQSVQKKFSNEEPRFVTQVCFFKWLDFNGSNAKR